MKYMLISFTLFSISGCLPTEDSQRSINNQAEEFVDPNGCHHWIIRLPSGEDYITQRLTDSGEPYCQ